ncbi:MAG: GNAT family N-acetyltransferase [Leifsonia xyli]|nr:MAG: GNAT family N-acetyltransferase [Leifsonia xyli]
MDTGAVDDLRTFLVGADLTVAGLDRAGLDPAGLEPTVRLWVDRADDGRVVGSTGYETSADGVHVLVRSVAVAPHLRGLGHGTRLARFAVDHAATTGARRAWLFSRRSGPFWQSLGFTPADRDDLAAAMADTHQVRSFRRTGQFAHEVAWSLDLTAV